MFKLLYFEIYKKNYPDNIRVIFVFLSHNELYLVYNRCNIDIKEVFVMTNFEMDYLEDKISKFIHSSNYYGTFYHSKGCQICKMPKVEKDRINELLLKGKGIQDVKEFVMTEYGNMFDPANVERCIRQHGKYLPYLLEDVTYKSIFKRAKKHLEDKNPNDLSDTEKLEVISKIEEEIIKEYSSFEYEKMSLMNVFYKETFPLLMTRLHNEIVEGKAKDIRDITEASQTILKMSSVMNQAVSISNVKDEEDQEPNFSKIDEKPESSTKEKIVSLTEKINRATGTG